MKTTANLLLFFCFLISFSCNKEESETLPDSYQEYLSDKYITSIRIFNQNIWVSSYNYCYDCYVPPYVSSIPISRQLTLINNSGYQCLDPTGFGIPYADHNGNLYIATYNSIFKINNINDYTKILETGDFIFNSFVFDENDNIWLSSNDGIAFWDGDELNIYNEDNSELPSNITHGLGIDQSGTVWVATDFRGLLKITDDTWEIIPNSEIPGLSNVSYLYNLIIDNGNNIWFNVHSPEGNSNILVYDGKDWTNQYPNQEGKGNIVMDSEGTIWVINNNYEYLNYFNTNLSFYKDNQWHEYDISDIEAKILTVNADHDKIYIGTTKGLVEKNK